MKNKVAFATLEGWRGVCAILVALYHFRTTTFLDHEQSIFIGNFQYFVDFFFVLSGFVIAFAYFDKIADRAEAYRFMTLRFWRIYPVHLLFLVLMILYQLLKWRLDGIAGGATGEPPLGNESISSIITHLLLIHSLGFELHRWNVPSWSISAEFYTYLTFAMLCLATVSNKTGRLWLFAIFGILGAVIVLVRTGELDTTREFGLFRCYYGFFIGCLIYQLYLHLNDKVRQHFMTYGTVHEIASVAIAILALCFIRGEVATFAFPPLFAYIVFAFSFGTGVLSTLICRSRLQALGLISYTVYMCHWLVMSVMTDGVRLLDHKFGGNHLTFAREVYFFGTNQRSGFLWLLAFLAIVVTVAAIVTATWEMPLRAYGRRRTAMRALSPHHPA